MRFYLSNGQASIDLGEHDTMESALRAADVAMSQGPDCDWSDWHITY